MSEPTNYELVTAWAILLILTGMGWFYFCMWYWVDYRNDKMAVPKALGSIFAPAILWAIWTIWRTP